MLKGITISCVVFCVGFLSAQNQRFFDQLDRTERVTYEELQPEDKKLEVMNFDRQKYEGLILHEVNLYRKKKRMTPLIQDSVFNQVCNTCVKHLPRSYMYNNGTPYWKVTRHTELGIRHLEGTNRVFTAYTFYTNLTNLKGYSTFYYDRKGPDGKMNLYFGTKGARKRNGDTKEVKPVSPITEKQWVRKITKTLYRMAKRYGIRSKKYSHIGISVLLDQYSVYRRRIPHAYVMIVVGGSQTQQIEEDKKPSVSRNVADSTLYMLLK